MRIVDQSGRSADEAVKSRLSKLLEAVKSSSRPMQEALLWTTRNHFTSIYPGSQHYSPDKVQPGDARDGASPHAQVDIDVPGVTRAYHDMHIRPRFRRHLTIPIHRQSYGKRAAEFPDLFQVKKRDGTLLLAQKTGGGLVFLYVLKDYVFQRQDKRLMPRDQTYADNIFSRISAHLDRALKN